MSTIKSSQTQTQTQTQTQNQTQTQTQLIIVTDNRSTSVECSEMDLVKLCKDIGLEKDHFIS